MSNEEKLSSGKYVLVSNVERNVKSFLLVISVLGLIAVGVRKYDLTFENQDEKYETTKHPTHTYHVEETKIISIENSIKEVKSEVQNLVDVVNVSIENQKKIGQDLQTIKNQN